MKALYKNKKININVKEISGLRKVLGLMMKRDSEALLFVFKEDKKISLHSFFVFFDFLVLWLDDKDCVLEWRIVKPFSFSVLPEKNFRKIIEIPLNRRNMHIVDFFVGRGKI